ncbi:hypothetical protein M1O54_07005, partial [Dehalococcoidia bacterium]|nr:hypothetical protein [Dehalococcoidia bacterium]
NGQELLEKAMSWQYFYNLVRPHYGTGMNEKTPFEKLKDLSYDLPEEFALFPPVILIPLALIGYWRLVMIYWPTTTRVSGEFPDPA